MESVAVSASVIPREVAPRLLSSWISDQCLKTLFQRLFSLESTRDCKVMDRCYLDNGSYSVKLDWRRPIRNGPKKVQLDGLNNLLLHFVPSSSRDSWEFSWNDSICFTVSLMRKYIESFTLSTDVEKIRWNNLIPIKLNILTCRISLDRIPTRLNLDSREIDLDSILCPVCNDEIETSQSSPYRLLNREILLDFGFQMVGLS
ncbi:reverse transcriptase domain, reverse transcriptase zinc-binding domain protein [Tanacetum coccineum]